MRTIFCNFNRSKKDKLELKRENEKKMVSEMILLYCKKNHHNGSVLCDECVQLNDYAITRIDNCPSMETKSFCSNCKIHCYKKDMREKIQKVMRFSGPRMIFYHPVKAIHHLIATKKEKKNMEKENEN